MRKNCSLKWQLSMIVAIGTLCNPSLFAQEVVLVEKPNAGYDKGFFISSSGGDYTLRTNGRVQTRALYSYEKSHHETRLSVPTARLLLSGHVFDPRIAFGSQFGFEGGTFKLVEFFGNFGFLPEDIYLKVGHFPGHYSLQETRSHGKLEFVERTKIFNDWNIGTINGLSLHRNKRKFISFDISVFENGVSDISKKRLGGISANVAINHNDMDPSDEADFVGGPLRAMISLGGFTRAQVETWKMVGYAGALEAMAKFYHTSINAGFFTGVREAPASAESTATNVVQKLEASQLKLGTYGQVGHVFNQTLGLAARYALTASYQQAPLEHEILGSASTYFYGHNLKLQLDGGVKLIDSAVTPQVRAQLQLAF